MRSARRMIGAALALALATPVSAELIHAAALSIPAAQARGQPIRVRLTAPAGRKPLPIILFSHGATYSGDDYQRLAGYWAAHGFAVLQPTHLDARILNLAADDPRRPHIWRQRRDDLVATLDHLAAIEAQVPALKGRLDGRHVVAIGHSYGALTTEMLLGANVADPESKRRDDLSEPRVLGGVLLSAPGGADGAAPEVRSKLTYLDVNWSTMRKPTLVMIGDLDDSSLSSIGPVWHEDPYKRAPAGAICLVALRHANHFLGGIGDGPLEKTEPHDEASIALVERETLAWARHLVAGTGRRAMARMVETLSRNASVSQARCR